MRRRVVLPAPEGAIRAVMEPALMVRLKLSSTFFVPVALQKSGNLDIGGHRNLSPLHFL